MRRHGKRKLSAAGGYQSRRQLLQREQQGSADTILASQHPFTSQEHRNVCLPPSCSMSSVQQSCQTTPSDASPAAVRSRANHPHLGHASPWLLFTVRCSRSIAQRHEAGRLKLQREPPQLHISDAASSQSRIPPSMTATQIPREAPTHFDLRRHVSLKIQPLLLHGGSIAGSCRHRGMQHSRFSRHDPSCAGTRNAIHGI